MKTACLLFLVLPAAAQYSSSSSSSNSSSNISSSSHKYYVYTTWGYCNGCEGEAMYVTTLDECKAAASSLGKLGQTILPSHVELTYYSSAPPYCTYYPNPDEVRSSDQGNPYSDRGGSLWMLSGDYTGECSPDRQCLCVQDYPTHDIKCGGEPDILTDENISVIVILGLSFLWAGPITWFFKRRLYPPLGWERVRGRVRGPCERGYGSTDESTTRDHAGIVLQGGPGGINGRGGADRQGGSVAMPTAIAMPGAATGSVAMPTVIATPGAAAAMPVAMGIVIS